MWTPVTKILIYKSSIPDNSSQMNIASSMPFPRDHMCGCISKVSSTQNTSEKLSKMNFQQEGC